MRSCSATRCEHGPSLASPDAKSFRENLLADPEAARHLTARELDAAMDSSLHLRALDDIFVRVFGDPGPVSHAAA